MLKILAVALTLVAFNLPAYAQNNDPDSGGITTGTIVVGTVGTGLLVWAIYAATKKKTTSP
jgi:hypothetical protein